ncbi:MAG TPA: hypothetical protein VHV55_06405 [Pirellulales bacterium]|jgi:hypothetical protein|nr:hypothetical protein [Pirellulales bacterium]
MDRYDAYNCLRQNLTALRCCRWHLALANTAFGTAPVNSEFWLDLCAIGNYSSKRHHQFESYCFRWRTAIDDVIPILLKVKLAIRLPPRGGGQFRRSAADRFAHFTRQITRLVVTRLLESVLFSPFGTDKGSSKQNPNFSKLNW